MAKPKCAVVLGGGIFGLKAAELLLHKGMSVCMVEADRAPFRRASLINQARLHAGYHYPRSLSTGLSAKRNQKRFIDEFKFAIVNDFTNIYAVAKYDSQTKAKDFEAYCARLEIPLKKISPEGIFQKDLVEGCYEVNELIFDPHKIGEYMLEKVQANRNFRLVVNSRLTTVQNADDRYRLILSSGEEIEADMVINATYVGTNDVLECFQVPSLDLKYELAEIVIGHVKAPFERYGITLVDGPFFSLMPLAEGNGHSLTSVQWTPRLTAHSILPSFSCMQRNTRCSGRAVQNCNSCSERPESKSGEMIHLIERYLDSSIRFTPQESRFAIKAVLNTSEVDDSRPTLLIRSGVGPTLLTVFSGKINTVYDLEQALE